MMTTELTQKNKKTVWDFWQELNNTEADNIANVIQSCVHQESSWHGPHPINHLQGADALIAEFWQPLWQSFPDLRRRSDIFFGGQFAGKDWVCATGYFIGAFAQDWLGIPATGRETNIHFGEFCSLKEGKIVEVYILLDLLDVMQQAGFQMLPPSLGAEGLVPGPKTKDGVLLTAQDELETHKSLQLVEAMLFGLGEYDQIDLSSMGMVKYWHPQMLWYGPGGIGTTRGIKGFEDYHQEPFLRAFPDRKGGDHKAKLAEGNYVASTGWPSLRATHAGEWLGCPATGKRIGMRVMDWWRREGDLLVENWVFIDIIDVFLQFGVDIFEKLRRQIQGKTPKAWSK